MPAGPNTISVIYKSSFGCANYLNLDNLVVGGDTPETIRITGISLPSPGSIHLTWTAINGQSYQVQFRDDAGSGTWTNLGAPILATGPTASADDTLSATPERYYRIVQP
jgi:hypothetical protein